MIGFTDANPTAGEQAYYKIIARDVHFNLSAPSAEAAVGAPMTSTLAIQNKWNIVSVPLLVSDFTKSVLFPTASTNAFAYDLGYAAYGTLENGRAYWMNFADAQSVPAGAIRVVATDELPPPPDALDAQAPEAYGLGQNYPNPFNPSTTIKFAVAKAAFTDIAVYDMLGRRVSTLASEDLKPGTYSVTWNGTDNSGATVASGVYYVRMAANSADGVNFAQVQKLLLMK